MPLDLFRGEDSVILRDNTRTTNVYYEFSIQRYADAEPKLKITSSAGEAGVRQLFSGTTLDVAIMQEILTHLRQPELVTMDTYGID